MEKKSPSQEDSHILSKYFITPKIINFFLFFYFYDKIGSCNIFCVSKKKKKKRTGKCEGFAQKTSYKKKLRQTVRSSLRKKNK